MSRVIEKHKLILVVSFLFWGIIGSAVSDPLEKSTAEKSTAVMSVRGLGMGGASVAVVDSEGLFLLNPASLSWVKYSYMSSLELKLGFSHDSIRSINRMNEYNKDNFTQLTKKEVDDLNTLTPLHKLNGPINIAYVRKYMGFGLFEASDVLSRSKYYADTNLSSLQLSVQQDVLGVASFAYARKPHPRLEPLSVGGTLKYIIRAKINQQDNQQDFQDFDDIMHHHGAIVDIGRRFGFDMGVLYGNIDKYAIGLIIRDAFSSQFIWDSRYEKKSISRIKSPRKTDTKTYATIGASYKPYWEIPSILKDVTLAIDMDSLRYPRAGIEASIFRFLKVRSGLSRDGIAFGMGLKWRALVFDYAFVSGIHDEYAGKIKNPSHFINLASKI